MYVFTKRHAHRDVYFFFLIQIHTFLLFNVLKREVSNVFLYIWTINYSYSYSYSCISEILVSLQIVFDVNLNFIEQFDFLEEFNDFGGINLSEKCVNVSCCIVLVSNMSKIRAFY